MRAAADAGVGPRWSPTSRSSDASSRGGSTPSRCPRATSSATRSSCRRSRRSRRSTRTRARVVVRTVPDRRGLSAIAEGRGVRVPDAYAPAHVMAERDRDRVRVAPMPWRPCHNDLLEANFLLRDGHVWIVDHEYAGMGDPSSTSGTSRSTTPCRTTRRRRAHAYFGEATDAHRARLKLMRIMSDFREAMWGGPARPVDARHRLRRVRGDAFRPAIDHDGRSPVRRLARRRARALIGGPTIAPGSRSWAASPGRASYHLAKLGWTDVLTGRTGELTSGSTFHSAGLAAPAPELREPHADDDVRPSSTRRSPPTRASTPDGTRSARCTSRRRRTGWRPGPPGGWAKSPGSRSRSSVEEALERFPIDVLRVLGAQFVPTDGHIDPTGLTLSFAAGAKAAGVVRTGVRVEEVTVRDGRVAGVVTDHGTIEADVVVNAGDRGARARTPRGCRDPGRADGAPVPDHATDRGRGRCVPDAPRPGQPRVRPGGGGRPGRRRIRTQPASGTSTTRSHRTSTTGCCRRSGERFEAIADGAFRLIPALQTTEINRFINGPEAFTPDDDFILGETEVAGSSSPPGSARTAHGRRRDRSLDRGVDRGGRALDGPLEDGRPAVRSAVREPRPSRRRTRSTRSTTTSGTRARSSSPAGRCGPRRPTVGPGAGRGVRREGRLGARQLVPVERGPGARGPAAARVAASSGRPRSWRSTSRPGTSDGGRRNELREDRSLGAQRPGTAAAAVRERRGREGRPHRVHADAEPPRGIESDLTVTRLDVDRFRLVIGTAFGSRDLAWRTHYIDGADVRVRDVTSSLGCLGDLGSGGPRRALVGLRPRPVERCVPVPHGTRPRRRRGPVPRRARDVRG